MGPLFVIGATGTQGGAVIKALLATDWPVRALVRDAAAPTAVALKAAGVELIEGNLDDESALKRGVTGAYGVFSVPMVGMDDEGLEVRAGRRLVEAAKDAKVEVFVHTSVARAGDHENFVDWEEGKWWPRYWRDKAAYNALVREAGFPHYVILKPAVMMENYIPPKARSLASSLAQGELRSFWPPATKLDLIAAQDIARFAVAAFEDPTRFSGAEIDLAGARVTMAELAAVISEASGKPVKAVHITRDEALAAGTPEGVFEGQQWNVVEGYKVDLDGVRRWGLSLTSLKDWAAAHQDKFDIGSDA